LEKELTQKILVLGASGMIGHQIYNNLILNENYDVLAHHSSNKFINASHLVDFFNFEDLRNFIEKEQPHITINCTGILIEESERDYPKAIYLNSYIPHAVKKLVNSYGGKLIQISTDCVFSGNNGPYSELDKKDGISNYSLTKGLGEIDDDINLTLRTSVIGPDYKPYSTELLHWYLNQQQNIEGYKKSLWSGVTSIYFAKVVNYFINSNITGIYNVSSSQSISKYDLLIMLERRFDRGINISKVDGLISNKILIDTRKLLGLEVPSYEFMIDELYNQMKNNHEYSHYFK